MILLGASGHAKVIIDILEKSSVTIDFLVDANADIKEFLGYKVKHESSFSAHEKDELIIAIGDNNVRKSIAEKTSAIFGWAIHPSVEIGDDVIIGSGTVVMANAVINSASQVGNHCIINTSASVDHDCRLMDYVHVSPNATLCGGITVGEGTHIGAGATVIPNITIGKWATIGAGAVIIEDVPDHATVVGNPGRIIKRTND